MNAYRARLLRFDPVRPGQALFDPDGLLVIGPGADGLQRVLDAGPQHQVAPRWPAAVVHDWRPWLIAPGFIDTHVHMPQLDVIGSPADGLLPWLEHYTFPEEARFADPAHAAEVAQAFVAELLRHGTTTALCFGTAHVASVDALMAAAQAQGMRLMGGKSMQDRHSPVALTDDTEASLIATEQLIQRWHGKGRLGYAITPRFAPTCSPAQLRGMGELAARHPSVWVQSHVAENTDEIAWVHELFPLASSYLGVYDDFGLLRARSVYAHCIHFGDADRALMHERGAGAAVCPTSNLFLGSGFFDFTRAQDSGMAHALASDIGGGTHLCALATMLAAYHVGRVSHAGRPGVGLAPQHLWWLHTAGAAQALGLGDAIGHLSVGAEADFVAINPAATPLLARRTQRADNLDELLFALIVLGDDRAMARTVVNGQVVARTDTAPMTR
jgi:guanine deaminase